jgi:hypothetical protein
MEVSWQTWAKLYAPYIAYALLTFVGGVYAMGYRNGISAILNASRADATAPRRTEPKCDF